MEMLSIEDVLLIAEVVLDVPGERLVLATRLDGANAALAAAARQTMLADAAAMLCSRLVRERPLPFGNKPVALLAMLELISRNHGVWTSPQGGEMETATTIERMAERGLSEVAFVTWVRAHARSR